MTELEEYLEHVHNIEKAAPLPWPLTLFPMSAITLWDRVYIRKKYIGTMLGASLVVHEGVHLRHLKELGGRIRFYLAWIFSRHRRLELEYEGYVAEVKFWAMHEPQNVEWARKQAIRCLSGPATWWATTKEHATAIMEMYA